MKEWWKEGLESSHFTYNFNKNIMRVMAVVKEIFWRYVVRQILLGISAGRFSYYVGRGISVVVWILYKFCGLSNPHLHFAKWGGPQNFIRKVLDKVHGFPVTFWHRNKHRWIFKVLFDRENVVVKMLIYVHNKVIVVIYRRIKQAFKKPSGPH